jgi:hypothetical protein
MPHGRGEVWARRVQEGQRQHPRVVMWSTVAFCLNLRHCRAYGTLSYLSPCGAREIYPLALRHEYPLSYNSLHEREVALARETICGTLNTKLSRRQLANG